MSRDDALQLHASSAESSSHHHHQQQHDEYDSSYDEDDHRRLMFGLMRSGLTPQVELALRLIEEANSTEPSSSRSRSLSRSRSTTEYEYEYDSSEEDGQDGDEEEYDEEEYDEDDRAGEFEGTTTRSEEDDMDNSPALTSKPLRQQFRGLSLQNTQNDDERARLGGKTDDQQPPLGIGSVNTGRYVQRWLADVRREGVIV